MNEIIFGGSQENNNYRNALSWFKGDNCVRLFLRFPLKKKTANAAANQDILNSFMIQHL